MRTFIVRYLYKRSRELKLTLFCSSDAALIHRAVSPPPAALATNSCLEFQVNIVDGDDEKDVPFSFRFQILGAVVLEVDWPEALQSPP